jgi:capsular exopolysaccharide synthesis family protein
LVEVYNQDANDEKNEVAQKTADFIDERIHKINNELGSAEDELADFKQRSGLTDLTSDAQLALQENSRYEQQLTQNATQISLVQDLQNYINDPKNVNEVIPANVGLEDQSLNSVISEYNSLIVDRKRLLRTSSENNPAVINLNSKIDAVRINVHTSVTSVLRGLRITQKSLEREASRFVGRISSAPKFEKEFLTIQRQQEIKATLYIMLLQKREENALTLAATASNGRIIETPIADKYPVAPRKKIFMLAALILGFAIPVGLIYLIDLMKYKIENRGDVEKLTTVPIVGEIPTNKGLKVGSGSIAIRENKNNIMEETFRTIRTNILFMLEKDQKVILFSSTQPGEGKSFVAANFATSLAYLGKKVVVVGMDIRKPGLNKAFGLNLHAKGITNYLSNPDQVNLLDMIQKSPYSDNLDILLGGTVPPNPTELVARPILDKAIEQLKSIYDYVILDTAPIGMVTDTAIIGRVADMCVYVCRADVTPKASYQFINILQKNNTFPKLATIINGIDMTKRKNSYGYDFGRKYGYGHGKHYGYGYGYGYGYEAENENDDKK